MKKYIFFVLIFLKIHSIPEDYKKICNLGLHEKKQLVKRIENIQKLVEFLQNAIDAFLKKSNSSDANWSDSERIKILINEQIKLQIEAFELQLLLNTKL
jgi:hypothetical protein